MREKRNDDRTNGIMVSLPVHGRPEIGPRRDIRGARKLPPYLYDTSRHWRVVGDLRSRRR